jgi:hypothetical protein
LRKKPLAESAILGPAALRFGLGPGSGGASAEPQKKRPSARLSSERQPVVDVARKTGGALTLFAANARHSRVHHSHDHRGFCVGVGAAGGVSAVGWNLASDVVTAGVLTLPAAALNFRPRPLPFA